MDALKRSDFMAHFKGQIFLSQFDAVKSLGCPPKSNATPTAAHGIAAIGPVG
jgi:hypothetical protein